MSGGVGPTGDGIRLIPREGKEKDEASDRTPLHDVPTTADAKRRRFLSFPQLNALAVITILAASGMVSSTDIAFAAFSLAYIYFLSSAAFPSSPSDDHAPVFGVRNPLLAGWVSAGALVGLVLPIAYIIDGVIEGDREGIKAAAPHVFLLACQVFAEGVTFARRFSLPIRAFVPVFYSAKRLVTIADWLQGEIEKGEVGAEHGFSVRRVLIGRGLAVANLVFWALNLFGFLLPVYLPRALKRYYAPSSSSKAKL